MSGWLDKNKGFVLTFLALMIPVVGSFVTLQGKAGQNQHKIEEIDAREQIETRRSQNVDNARTGQMARMETRLEYIQRDLNKLGDGQEELLRWLREKKDGDGK